MGTHGWGEGGGGGLTPAGTRASSGGGAISISRSNKSLVLTKHKIVPRALLHHRITIQRWEVSSLGHVCLSISVVVVRVPRLEAAIAVRVMQQEG